MTTDREALLRRAAELACELAESGFAKAPEPLAQAVAEARRAGITIEEISAYGSRLRKQGR
ncbi:hypothetical protein ABR738_37420 [Streptomyces sp. Edi4]|uniref:hypothetical protein n=1 Tax=Streptomyces sp. Edi4 TaxID=3162527 RepID=UPI0033065BA6